MAEFVKLSYDQIINKAKTNAVFAIGLIVDNNPDAVRNNLLSTFPQIANEINSYDNNQMTQFIVNLIKTGSYVLAMQMLAVPYNPTAQNYTAGLADAFPPDPNNPVPGLPQGVNYKTFFGNLISGLGNTILGILGVNTNENPEPEPEPEPENKIFGLDPLMFFALMGTLAIVIISIVTITNRK